MSEAASATPTEGRRVVGGALRMGAGEATGLALGFVTTILVTDSLGEQGYGLFVGAQRFVLLFVVIAKFGLHPLLVRAVATRRDEPGALLGTVLFLRALLGLVFLVIVVGAAHAGDYLPEHRWLLYTFAAMEFVGVFVDALMALCEGREHMGRSALISVFRSVATLTGVGVVIAMGGGLPGLVAVYLGARVLQLAGALALLPGVAPGLRLCVRREQLALILREAVPFVAVSFAYMSMRAIDVMMLTRFAPIAEASHYGASLNFIDVLLHVPLLLQRVLLPVFSRLHISGSQSELPKSTLIAFSAVLLPAGAGIALLANAALALYPSGEFAAARPVLQVLALTLAVVAPFTVCGTLLTGAGRLWTILGCYLVALVVQVIVNALLIGEHGAVGVAWGTVCAYTTVTALLVYSARALGLALPLAAMGRHLAATAVVAAVVFVARDLLPVVPIVLGAGVYVTVLLSLTPRDGLERRLAAELLGRVRGRG